jgi:uncharacterized repeat protein (TIGR03803 family)
MNQGNRFFVRAYFLATAAVLVPEHAFAQQAAAPVFLPGEGVYRTAQTVSISDATTGAKIYYTIDGTAPTRASTEYTGAITISSTATLRALAMAPGYAQGARAAAIYRIVPLAARPVFSPPEGAYRSTQTVSISDATAGATIYYTTDGTTPTTGSPVYKGVLTVGSDEILHAIALAPGFSQSPTARAYYEFPPFVTATPIFSPMGGTYDAPQRVSIIDAGAAIFYTTDGTTPTTASRAYAGAITVSATETLQAIAVTQGHPQSAVANAAYDITPGPVTESTLYSFTANGVPGRPDGSLPQAPLIEGSDGNFYGTTANGGVYEKAGPPGNSCYNGCGTVFRVTTAGVETLLYEFNYLVDGSTDGADPDSLIQASDGNFYGTTAYGGANPNGYTCCDGVGAGTLFKVTPAGLETVLYSFGASFKDGATVDSTFQGSDGNFYGTTTAGGSAGGGGSVFKITPGGSETLIYSFPGDLLIFPNGLIQGSDGNLFGTTANGGAHGLGSAFEITPAGVETLLYSFGAYPGDAGNNPRESFPGTMIQASDGNFYGTTGGGGAYGAGAIFKLTPAGIETVLYSFSGCFYICGSTDGSDPVGLIQGSDGNFYGTTLFGGVYAAGTAFKVTPAGVETVLHSFNGGYYGDPGSADGYHPGAGLIEGSDGNLYGTTSFGGGEYGSGTVFKLTGAIDARSSSKPKTSSAVERLQQ